jgi:ABC-type molybdate transport system substrate-binding protein
VIIIVDSALGNLIKSGKVTADSRVELARSGIGMAVRAGAPKPDIRTPAAFKQTLLRAKSIAYSDSASGVYLSTELFQRLGIVDQLKGTARMIPAEPVGQVVARGEAEIGFQQISELRPVKGIDIVGPLPSQPTPRKWKPRKRSSDSSRRRRLLPSLRSRAWSRLPQNRSDGIQFAMTGPPGQETKRPRLSS